MLNAIGMLQKSSAFS